METPDLIRIGDLSLFADCTKSELRKLDSLMTYVRVPKDRILMRQGRPANEFIIIGQGCARVSRETGDGVTKVADVGSGEFLGEMGLLTGSPRSATATATTDLALFASSACEFRSILRVAPSVADKVVRTSVARAAHLELAA
ncbi:MAG TPA: cyclic nucleotide-binding domain-containing protein [Acidimicrobiales bacterium]|nr:cyclic nucleotide-binding domain-containing protein [Acidimicrobiales bacterium]